LVKIVKNKTIEIQLLKIKITGKSIISNTKLFCYWSILSSSTPGVSLLPLHWLLLLRIMLIIIY